MPDRGHPEQGRTTSLIDRWQLRDASFACFPERFERIARWSSNKTWEADVNSETNAGVAVRQNEEKIDEILGHEYEHEPVPAAARRSLFSVTMVWIGFPMIITGAMTGSILVLGMGFKSALIAMIVGNLIMFAYVGSLGLIGTRRGMNFALIASIVFGKSGYVLASGLLSTLLLGWYAVQTGITGALIS